MKGISAGKLSDTIPSRELLLSSCKRYQKTVAEAVATFTAPGLESQSTYVTNLVQFQSSDSSVASVQGNDVYGLKVGHADIYVENYGNFTMVTPDEVIVSNSPVHVVNLSVAAVTDASPTTVMGAPEGTVAFQINQVLNVVNDRANVTVSAIFDDGYFADITDEAVVTSNVLDIAMTTDGIGPQIEVTSLAPLGPSGGKYIHATWNVYNPILDQCEITSGDGNVQLFIHSGAPSAQPTSVPTVSFSPTSYPTIADLTVYFSKLHPDIVITSGFAIPKANETYLVSELQLEATFARPFGAMFGGTPGSSGALQIQMGGRRFSSKSTFTVDKNLLSTLTAVVKTVELYRTHNTMAVTFQVRGSQGSSQVYTSGLSVTMTVSISGQTMTFNCGSPNAQTGIGSCSGSVPTSWFSSAGAVLLTGTVRATQSGLPGGFIVSNTFTSVLQKVVTYAAHLYGNGNGNAIGMLMTMDPAPKYQGDRFTTPITADTGNNALNTWLITLTYDPAVVRFISAATSSLFVSAIVTAPTSTTVKMSSSSLASGVSAAQATGSAVPIGSITWEVLASADTVTNGGVHPNAVGLHVDQMVNEYSLTLVLDKIGSTPITDKYGQINGELETTDLSSDADLANGQVTVVMQEYTGIVAYTAKHELINSARLDNVTVSQTIVAIGVVNRASKADEVITTDSKLRCLHRDPEDTAIFDLSVSTNCALSMTQKHHNGSSSVFVDVDYDGGKFSANVPFTIWTYLSFELSVADSILNLIV